MENSPTEGVPDPEKAPEKGVRYRRGSQKRARKDAHDRKYESLHKIRYTPTPPQREFGKMLAAGKRVVLFKGGIRVGKTFAGAFESLKQIYEYARQPNLGWIVSPTYPMSSVTERAFREAAGDLIIKEYRGERAFLMYPNKHSTVPFRVEFKTAEYPDRLRGAGCAWIWIDEAAMISEECWRILLGRVLDTKGVIFMTTTPRGSNWLKTEVYDQAKTNPLYGVVTAKTAENPYLDPTDIQALRNKYSEDFAHQELDAEFVSFDGLVYRSFNYDRHVCQPWIGEPPEGAELVGGVDFGYADPFVHLWIARYGGRFYVVDEYYEKFRTMQAHATSIHAARFDKYVIRRWADPSGAQARTDLDSLGVMTYPANNELDAGINAVSRMLETGQLLIAKNCINTLKEISEYHYEVRDAKNAGRKPVDYANHCMDALRYAIYSESGYQKAHPYLVVGDDGSMTLQGVTGNPLSNRLEDWIKLPANNHSGWFHEDDLMEEAMGVDIEE